MKNRIRAVLYGAVAGAVLGLAGMAIAGGRFALGAPVAQPVSEGSPLARALFEASTGGLYLIVIVVAALGGLIVAGAAFAVGTESEPDAERFPLRYLLPAAAIVSAATAYVGLRAGVGAWGDIEAGVATVPVMALVLILAASGALAGAVTADVVDRLARPSLLGLGGKAWPTSPGALVGELVRALGTPLVAVVVIATFAISLSQLLLALGGVAAVAIFSSVGAIVLVVATLAAYRPWAKT